MKDKQKLIVKLKFLLLKSWLLIAATPFAHAQIFGLPEAVSRAQALDPWLVGSEEQQKSLEAQSIQAGTLPDPTINLAVANLPTDTFDFAQEPMTQFKVGVSQMFPRGKTRALKSEKLQTMSQAQPFARADRKARVAAAVAQLWLEVYKQQQTISLIENDRSLFEHLVDISQSSYTTASGKSRQQDLVRAQLELTRLDDRLTQLRQMRNDKLALLGEWLQAEHLQVSKRTPQDLTIRSPQLVIAEDANTAELVHTLLAHPMILAIDKKIASAHTGVSLAKESYKPQWGLNASYGYRDADPNGRDRADFFSAGLSFDVPLFSANRQDKLVASATADLENIKTERALAIRKLRSGFDAATARLLALQQRKTLFDSRLLKEMSDQAEASLTAYTNDEGDFAEVVRARIAELNARIDALGIRIDIQKNIAQVNYFLAGNPITGEEHE